MQIGSLMLLHFFLERKMQKHSLHFGPFCIKISMACQPNRRQCENILVSLGIHGENPVEIH